MKKVLYSGFYGFKNTGDDVFLEVTSWASKFLLNTTDVTFLTSNLPILNYNDSKHLSKSLFPGHNRIQSFNKLLTADYFISAGGSVFMNHHYHSIKEVAEYTKLFFNNKLKTGAIGVSIGPFKNISNENKVIKYLKKINFLSTRDKRSFDYVSSLNLPYTPIDSFDLAALLPLIYPSSIKPNIYSSKKIIGISVCNVESLNDPKNIHIEIKRNKMFIDLINILNKNSNGDVIFRFFILNGNEFIGDKNLSEYIIKVTNIKNYEIINYQNNVFSTWRYISECDFMISIRLHGAIMAAYNKIPFILFDYHQKCTDFLYDIGQDKRLLINEENNHGIKNISLLILEIIYGYTKPISPLYIDLTSRRALLNFNFINV
jgi:polysaccharide pyruvyl transferase WcaK-like protein